MSKLEQQFFHIRRVNLSSPEVSTRLSFINLVRFRFFLVILFCFTKHPLSSAEDSNSVLETKILKSSTTGYALGPKEANLKSDQAKFFTSGEPF
jgi:hypothetical protein